MTLSTEFMDRLNTLAKLAPNWDGEDADVVSIVALKEAERLAEMSLAVAHEPWAGPCATGEVLLEWTFPNGNEADYFVGDVWNDMGVIVIESEQVPVKERHVADAAALMALLKEIA